MFLTLTGIGGSDGPTKIYTVGRPGFGWLNAFGLIIIVLIMLPNIIYFVKHKEEKNLCASKFMNILEAIGRYGCMVLMVFFIGKHEPGFFSKGSFITYLIGNAVLIIAYYVFWIMYFYRRSFAKELVLAIIPAAIFLLSGITLVHVLLIIFAVIFGTGQVYVTAKNRRPEKYVVKEKQSEE